MGVIEVENLVKRYAGRTVLDRVSFTVERGEIFGILGPNGAGKTTTVECIEGLRHPDSGRVTVLGADPRRDPYALRHRLGAQLQESRLPNRIRVWEALDLYASFYRDPVPWRDLAEQVGLGQKLDTRFADLSGGQKQRLSVALALVGDPEIAILDELTSGLDPQARRDMWGLVASIRGRGVTIVLVTHFMEEAERLCDRLVLIDRGKVMAADTPTGVIARIRPEIRISFRPSRPLEDGELARLPEVTTVLRDGGLIVITGTGNVLHAVTSQLASHDVVAEGLRVETANLDDAFLALTGPRPDDPPLSTWGRTS